MFQPIFEAYSLSSVGIPVNYIDLLKYCKQLQSQLMYLRQKCEKIQKQNEQLITSSTKNQRERLKNQPENIISKQIKTVTKRKRRRRRRSFDSIQKHYKCSFLNCSKQYASELALNLHMRIKHNGGTKTEREQLAKEIILAQQRGITSPQITINFPPGFINEFRKEFFNGF